MFIELGNVKFEEKTLFRQFRQDLRDDWFPDPLNLKDMLEQGITSQRIAANFNDNHGQYVPIARTMFNIPKANYTLRYALESGTSDRILYHGLTSFLISYYDDLIPWYVYSHRAAPNDQRDRYLFRNSIGAWKDFIGTVKAALSRDKFLLSTDVANYFENIDLAVLRKNFLYYLTNIKATSIQKNEVRAHLSILFHCLRFWCYEPQRGLPQNRDASSFLSNIYMLSIDEEMRKRGYEYFRYVDDIKIICKDVFHARKALKELSVLLREKALSLNSKKTRIHPADDNSSINECLDTGVPKVEYIEVLWSTKSRGPIVRSLPILKQYTQEIIEKDGFDSREFRFCIGKLVTLASCKELTVPDAYFEDITKSIIKNIPLFPVSTDQFTKYLLHTKTMDNDLLQIASYLIDTEKSFYTWQNYRLWKLLAQKKYKNDDLLKAAIELLSLENDNPGTAGAMLYIGSMGDVSQKEHVAKCFKAFKSFLAQRCALIACHELPYNPIVESFITPYVREDLKGVYSNLQKKSRGQYFAAVEKTSITTIINSDRDYD